MSLPEALTGFRLPVPPEGEVLRDAVRASLGLLRLGPDRVTFPLLAAVYRAVLGDTDFGLHLPGPTGCYKTAVAALAQQHFGAGLDARHLPADWSSTGNALEGLAFAAKDAMLVVDDFCPAGSSADVQRSYAKADRVFRGQGNRSGRQRMGPDGSLRPPRPPRGLTLSTGEDTPPGQSLRARLLAVEISPGDFGPPPPQPNPVLTACQRDADGGRYAAALSGFARWLAPRYEAVRGRLRSEAAELRGQLSAVGQHARTPGILADLALGLRYLLDFSLVAGAVAPSERERLWARGWAALADVGAGQAGQLAEAEPAALFVRLLVAALARGSAHVAGKDGGEPDQPHRWGWRAEDNAGESPRYRAQGDRVGWLADGELYLEAEASYGVVQAFAREQGGGLDVKAPTLRRRLKERGLLASTDAGRGKLTVRRTLQGERREVLHLRLPLSDEAVPAGRDGPPPWEGGRPTDSVGRLGRLGRSNAEGEPDGGDNNAEEL